jgi:hypothetical protein
MLNSSHGRPFLDAAFTMLKNPNKSSHDHTTTRPRDHTTTTTRPRPHDRDHNHAIYGNYRKFTKQYEDLQNTANINNKLRIPNPTTRPHDHNHAIYENQVKFTTRPHDHDHTDANVLIVQHFAMFPYLHFFRFLIKIVSYSTLELCKNHI